MGNSTPRRGKIRSGDSERSLRKPMQLLGCDSSNAPKIFARFSLIVTKLPRGTISGSNPYTTCATSFKLFGTTCLQYNFLYPFYNKLLQKVTPSLCLLPMLTLLWAYSRASILSSVSTLLRSPPGKNLRRKQSSRSTPFLCSQRYQDCSLGMMVRADISNYPSSLGYNCPYSTTTGRYLTSAELLLISLNLFQLFSSFLLRHFSSSSLSASPNSSPLATSSTRSSNLQWWSSRTHFRTPSVSLACSTADSMLSGISFLLVVVSLSFPVSPLYFLYNLASLSFFCLSYSSFNFIAYSLVFSFCFLRNSSTFSSFCDYFMLLSLSLILPSSIRISRSSCYRFFSRSRSSFDWGLGLMGQGSAGGLALSNLNFFIYYKPEMIARVLTQTFRNTFVSFPVFFFSEQTHRKDLLSSQYHAHGIRHFPKTKHLVRSLNPSLFEVDRLITELQKSRMRLLQGGIGTGQASEWDRPECSKYYEIYNKLVQRMGDVKVKQEWGFRVAGWYNMQPFLQPMIEELLEGEKASHPVLIESIHWMQPHEVEYRQEESVQELIKQKIKLDHFYRQLNYGISIDTLRQIQGIFGYYVTQCKSKYYQQYLLNNLNSLLQSSTQIQDLLWLSQTYVATFNDDPALLARLEHFFLTRLDTDRVAIAKSFIRIYNQSGRANPQLFQQCIKPYLATTPHIIEVQLMNLQFLVHSEAGDEQALNGTLRQIAKIARTQPISDGHRLHAHYLLHYLRIKNIKYSFPPNINREFTEACRTFEEDGTLAKLMAIELDEKSRKEGVDYFNSNCVLKKKHFAPSSKSGEEIKKLEGFKKFSNVKFCCLKLDVCVYNESQRKAVVLQKHYHRFQQSGRLIRMQQVKADILKHYGFQINYLQPKSQSPQP